MFSRKKPARPARTKPSSRSGSGLSQYGLFDIPDINNVGMNDVGDDEDDDVELEAELLALTAGSAPSPRPKTVRPVPETYQHLDTMVAESVRDIPSDESLSGDEDDPALLAELSALQGDEEHSTEEKQNGKEQGVVTRPEPETLPGPSLNSTLSMEVLLKERLEMYKLAEANAKAANEAARARRFNRGIGTLQHLLKETIAGQPINEEDIPPPVAVGGAKKPDPAPSAQQPDQPQSPVAQETRDLPPVPSRRAPPPPVPPRSVVNYGVALPGLVDLNELPSPPKRTPTSKPPTPSEPSEPTSTASDDSASSVPETVPAPEDMTPHDQANTMALLTERRDQYKQAALQAKRSGDAELALTFVKVVKKFDAVISAVTEGKPVDLSAMPPSPPTLQTTSPQPQPERQRRNSETQESSEPQPPQDAEAAEESEEPVYIVEIPSTVLEALEQRLAKYKSQEEAAKADNNASKARRMGRIVKQYEDAIKLERAGRPIPVDELPTPPGYPPIPVGGDSSSAVPKPVSAQQPPPPPAPKQPTAPAPTSQASEPKQLSPKVNVRKIEGSRQEKQLALLMDRQKQFKLAALEAKKKGEINQAREYLRLAKGFDPLIEASNCGLPVDMDTIPVPPSASASLESEFDIISADDCSLNSDADIYERLEKDLIEQLKKFVGTRNHFKAIGDVASANRFEQQALNTKKDLDIIRIARKNQSPVPRFHYETRSFSIVQCNTDLATNDLELTIVQGVNYNVPNPREVDTYVRFEFPYPSEAPPRDKTPVIYNTNNPIYEERFTLAIQRNRACQRVFKRHGIKFEIWAKGGFFRGDTMIGTVVVKLQPLETKCTFHDSFDVMDGRKTTGGKLEVKLRVRDPILTKQVEQVQEKWLVIDQ